MKEFCMFNQSIEELFYNEGIINWYESAHESNKSMIKSFEKYGFKYKRDLVYFIRKNLA